MKHRSLSLLCVALSLGVAARTDATPVPQSIQVLSRVSTSGSFGLAITGVVAADCDALASAVSILDAVTLRVTELDTCKYAVVPAAQLATGQHCISVSGFVGLVQQPCFEVTGESADPTRARLSLTPKPPDGWARSSCKPCSHDPSLSACTRELRAQAAVIALENVPAELASTHAFAVLELGPEGFGEPVVSDFFLMGSDLSTQRVLFRQRPEDKSCVAVYARAFSSASVVKVGEQCLEPTLPDTLPASLGPQFVGCEADFSARWCADNRADCESSGSSIAACADYAAACAEGDPDASAGEPQSDAAPDARPTPPSAGGSPDGAVGSMSQDKRTAGCALAGAASATPPTALFAMVAFVALWRRRAQPGVRCTALRALAARGAGSDPRRPLV